MLKVRIERQLSDFSLKADLSVGNEIVVLFGPSGSGKSTLIKCMAGLLRPDAGEITLKGRDIFSSKKRIDLKARNRSVAYVPQEYALFPHLTVVQNIEYGLKSTKARDQDGKVTELLALMRIENLKERFPSQLSGGEKQRVALARALITQPSLVLLDEPFSAIDEKVRLEVQSELYELQKIWGVPFLLVTHDQREVDRLGAGKAQLTIGESVHEFRYSEEMRPDSPSVLFSY